MSGNTPFIVQTNTPAKGFSLAEVLIVVACVIVIAVLCLQVLKKIIPDREERMYKKAFNITARVVPALVANDALYPEVDGLNALQNLGNTEWVMYEGKKYEGETKFCGLFGAKLNALSAVDCSEKTKFADGELPNGTLTTNDGIVWQLPITKFDNLKVPGEIYLDTNGDKMPNCFYKSGSCEFPDRYTIYVYQDGTVSDTPVNMPDLPVLADATPETDFEIPSNWQPSTPYNPDTVPIDNTNPEPQPVEPSQEEDDDNVSSEGVPSSTDIDEAPVTPDTPLTPTIDEDNSDEQETTPVFPAPSGSDDLYIHVTINDIDPLMIQNYDEQEKVTVEYANWSFYIERIFRRDLFAQITEYVNSTLANEGVNLMNYSNTIYEKLFEIHQEIITDRLHSSDFNASIYADNKITLSIYSGANAYVQYFDYRLSKINFASYRN